MLEVFNILAFPAFLILPLLIAGTAVAAYGAYQQGQAMKEQSEAEADILAQNAKLKEREADAQREAAKLEAEQFEKRGKRLLGEQAVTYAKGGVLTTMGTPVAVMEETEKELAADRLTILKEGYLRGSFLESEAYGLRYQSAAAKARGASYARGSVLSAGGTLLTGFGQAAYMKKMMR